jgi:uncharacterized membrane protein YuzA (DUF378 family)
MAICKECGQEISEEQYRNFYGKCPACNRLEKSIHEKKNSEASINFALCGMFGFGAFITLILGIVIAPFFLIATGFCAFISIGNYFVGKMNQKKAQEWKKNRI